MNITIINTGGTFNKRYNEIKGTLDVPTDALSFDKILKWTHNVDFEIKNIISKDSLDMNNIDRDIIVNTINSSLNDKVIIIHGTDTMNETALYLSERIKNKQVILTGAMIPISIDETEAVMNFSTAMGFLNANIEEGIYIGLHGLVVKHDKIYKNKEIGKFLLK